MAGWAPGEARREPVLGGGAGDRVEPVRPDHHTALAPGVGRAVAGGGGHQREGGDPVRAGEGQLGADRAADGTAGVAEAVHSQCVEGGDQPVGQLGDGGGRVGGRAAVTGQVETDDAPVAGQFGDLPVPHVPCGTKRGTQDEYGGVVGTINPVLQGLLAHRATLSNSLTRS